MTDRELLERAAMAAGMPVRWYIHGFVHLDADGLDAGWWNPLTDDGDALRLAVKLELCVTPYPIFASPRHSVICTRRFSSPDDALIEAVELYGTDPAAATRRAITRAAAAMAQTGE